MVISEWVMIDVARKFYIKNYICSCRKFYSLRTAYNGDIEGVFGLLVKLLMCIMINAPK